MIEWPLTASDGYTVAHWVRQTKWGANICLIALTGRVGGSDRQPGDDAGFSHYLVKPVDPEALQRMIDASCETRAMPPMFPRAPQSIL